MTRQEQMNLFFWISRLLLMPRDCSGHGEKGSAVCVYPFTVGGGIRTVEDFRALLREGADKISTNSSAINTPELIHDAAEKFGSQCVVVAIDAKKRPDQRGWNIYKNGGRVDVGIDAVEWAKKVESLGAGETFDQYGPRWDKSRV